MSTPIYIGWKHVYRYEIQKSIYISIEWGVNIYIHDRIFEAHGDIFKSLGFLFCFVPVYR